MKKCFMEIKRPERPRSEVYDRTHRYRESSIGTSDEGDRNADQLRQNGPENPYGEGMHLVKDGGRTVNMVDQ